MGCLSQEIEGTVSRRDGAAGQVCLRERVPGTPQPAGVRPGYKRAAGFLHPLRCYYPRKESEGKSRHNITIENRTRSAAGTAQRDRIPNLNPIGGRISTTQSNKTKIDRVSQPSRWNGKQDSTEVQTSEQGHAHLVCCHLLHEDCLRWETRGTDIRGKISRPSPRGQMQGPPRPAPALGVKGHRPGLHPTLRRRAREGQF